MSYIRVYREEFIESTELEYLYIHHMLMFVDYIEHIGMGDKKVEIKSGHPCANQR